MSARGTAISFEDFQSIRNFAALDGLRAVAVFLVFAAHMGGIAASKFSGWLGVHAFFVLSGFLITTLLLRERDGTGRVSLKAFYIRRTTRLVPLYLLIYLVVLAQSYLAQDASWEQMKVATPYYLTLCNELAPYAPLVVTWTLSVEWKYYLVWPTLITVFGLTTRSRLATVGLCMAALAALGLSGAQPDWLSPQNYIGMMIGSALAILMHTPTTFGWVRGLMTYRAPLVILPLLFIVHRRFPLVTSYIGDLGAITLYGLLVGLLLPSLIASRTFMGKALGAKWLVFIGHRSYAMYLIQYIAAHAVLDVLSVIGVVIVNGPALLLLSFIVSLAISDLLYRWFEKPITDWGHRWAKSTKQAALSRTAATGVGNPAARSLL
ncbi:acyltransferase family protein [Variovorax sp. PAMC26660]|uniref:acyltransferase family protein n=1 Tax=Variovorax sp. PAMC26660 TaxID=2762322 RepID=UPI00164E95BA|nr:acyltransferase [Variovorax sp. PAMC26660]QNK65065.1 acyltransferase [Variovorax sp. PAMC26660]